MDRSGVDWRAYMEIALGVLGWTPQVFWSATPHEFWAAWSGWRRANVSEPTVGGGRMTVDEYDEVRELLDAEVGKVYRPGEGQVLTPLEFRQRLN